MVKQSRDTDTVLVGYVGDIVLPDFPPVAEALAARIGQRIYLRRWLLTLSVSVIVIFVLIYGLPLLPACLGIASIAAGAAFIPREGVFRPIQLNLGGTENMADERIFSDMIEALPSPVILLNVQGRILRFNRLALEFWPALRNGDHISSVIRDPGVLQTVADLRASSLLRHSVSFEQRAPIERYMEATISWIGDKEKRCGNRGPAILLHLRDLTEHERLDKLRTDFVANASHELRTPLASLIGFIETLQGAARHDHVAREHFLDIMARQARRMARLIDNLLSLSRIEMRVHLKPQQRVDLVDLAHHVLADLRPLAEQTGVHFHFKKSVKSALVLGDRDELIQVLANLIENSVKYGRSGGNVWLSLGKREGAGKNSFFLTVRDDGEGIHEKHLPRLTERFYRANDNGGEKSGTGLGLSIVKHVITRHRGELTIASELGKGSEFTIILSEATPDAGP